MMKARETKGRHVVIHNLRAVMNNIVSTIEEVYATIPMSVVRFSSLVQSDEEEIYASFEQAMSARLTSYGYRARSNNTLLALRRSSYETGPIVHEPLSIPSISQPESRRKFKEKKTDKVEQIWRNTLLICFAIMCMLAGFDLMGLLILHMR